MSARLTAQQNKVRLIAVFLFTLMLGLLVRGYMGYFHAQRGEAASNAATLDDSLFIGIRHVPAVEVRQAIPEAAKQPALLYFGSKLCHDCQRMSPIVTQLVGNYPDVYFKKLDVLDDQAKAPGIFRAFKPVSVPVMVFIASGGEIRNVLYDYQKPEVVAAAIKGIRQQPIAKGAPNPPLKPASSASHKKS